MNRWYYRRTPTYIRVGTHKYLYEWVYGQFIRRISRVWAPGMYCQLKYYWRAK